MQSRNKNINNKGFTLVELLATISILAIIMLLAIPNVVGVVQRSRNKTYVEDAKKLVALAKYKVKSDSRVKKELSRSGTSVCLYISYLDKGGEIKDAPNGGSYSNKSSYVKVTRDYTDEYSYEVQLLETSSKVEYSNGEKEDKDLQGLNEISSEDLSKDSAYKKVETNVYSNGCYGTGKDFK